MAQKSKKAVANNKFNFDEEYIIGISKSEQLQKKKQQPKKNNKNNKKKPNNKQKKKAKKTVDIVKLKKRIVTFMIILVFITAIGCFLCLSPIFNVQEIIVENNNLISADTIRSLSTIQLYKNIFLMSKHDAKENIEKNPYVEYVEISRELPNKVKIVVHERTEQSLIEFAEGKFVIIDRQGYILGIAEEPKQLPILVGTETDNETLIQSNEDNKRLCDKDLKKLDIVNSIIDTAKQYEVYSCITKIDISDTSNVILTLAGESKTAYLGNCTQLYARMGHMKTIIEAESGKSGKIFVDGTLQDMPGQRAYFREDV